MLEIIRLALKKGFKYEYAQYANSEVFSKEEMLSLGMEV